jgi:hypothetical protein
MSAGLSPTAPPPAKAESAPPGRPPAPAASRFTAVVLRRPEELQEHLAAWDDLARSALEPNVFYESWMLVPALRAFGAGMPFRFVLLYECDPKRPHAPPALAGFFPLVRRRGYKGVPFRYLTLWHHPYAYYCVPLLRREGAAECLSFFFNWLATDRDGAALLELPIIGGEGPFHQLLVDHLNAHGRLHFVADAYTRALLERHESGEAYLAEALPGKRRKGLNRLLRRLGETGTLEFRTLEAGGGLQPWLDDFLKLEASGWKGQRGTAITCQDWHRRFFHEMARGAFERGRLLMLGLFLDGRPVALKCSLRGGPGSFGFKIAFDEDFAHYSPGLQLEIENIRRLHDISGLQWMDSCSSFDAILFNRLYRERRTIRTVLVSSGRAPGDLVVSLLPLLRWAKRFFSGRKPATAPDPAEATGDVT